MTFYAVSGMVVIKEHFFSIDQALLESSGSMEVSFSKVDIEVLPVFMDA